MPTTDAYLTQLLNPSPDVSKEVEKVIGDKKLIGLDQFDKIDPAKVRQGHGSTLDADTLDGYHAAQFVRLLNSSSQSLFNDGTVALPSISFINDTDTGFYRISANALGVSAGGAQSIAIGMNDAVFKVPVQAPFGSSGTPSFGFDTDTDTGMYRSGTDTIGFATGGTKRFEILSTGIKGPDGVVGTPTFTFINDTNTGIYLPTADTLGFALGGTSYLSFATTGASFGNLILGPAGAASTPAFSFTGDANTGMYNDSADVLAFSTGGTERFKIDSTGFYEKARTTPVGHWIAPAFDAAVYFAGGSQTWTVGSGDQGFGNYNYTLIGKTMILNIYLDATTVGGTPHSQLKVTLPGGFTAASTSDQIGWCMYKDNGTIGYGRWQTGGTFLYIFKGDESNWTASTNNTSVYFTATIHIA